MKQNPLRNFDVHGGEIITLMDIYLNGALLISIRIPM